MVIVEGVTILNQFEVVTKTVFNWPAFWTGVLIGVGISLIIATAVGLIEEEWSAFFFSLIICSISATSISGPVAGGALCREPVEYETRYEVSVDQTVNMQEFMDKYEIIDTRGSIYTVREK